MSRQFIYPTQDAAIYQQYLSRNTGFDEILEVGKTVATASAISNITPVSDIPPAIVLTGLNTVRSLVLFDITGSFSQSYVNGTIPLNAIHYLNLRMAYSTGLQNQQLLQIFMVSQSWTEGTGYFAQDVKNPSDGVTWLQRDVQGDLWPSGTGGQFITSSGAPSASILFAYPPSDLRVDVTTFVQAWVSGTFPNYGFFLKLPTADEQNNQLTVDFKFYSNQTHTIYRPTIESVWNAQTFATGNLLPLANFYFTPFFRNLQPSYLSGSFSRIDIGVRNTYPIKSFDSIFVFAPQYFLPTSSYYSIVDAQTNYSIIPFDSGSLLNCDISSSFIPLYTQNMYPNRLYKILLRVDMNGQTLLFDQNTTFRVR